MKKFVLAALALLTAACSATPTPKPAILTAKEQAALDCIGHGGTWQIAYPGPVYTCTPSALPPVPVVSK